MREKIVLSISEAGTPAAKTFALRVFARGSCIAQQVLTPVQSQEVREIAGQYMSLFEKGCSTEARDYLDILGAGIFRLFLEGIWQQMKPEFEEGADLAVASQIPEVLRLPWETLRLPGSGAEVGFDEKFSLRRVPRPIESPVAFSGELRPGLLRVLFMACEPLYYEKEEIWMLQAAEGLEMALEICNTGSFEELKRRVRAFRPHIVHLVGQAKRREGQARFSFQGEGSREDLISAEELAAALAGSQVQCLLLGGCQAEDPSALDDLCQAAALHLPLAVGWNGPTERVQSLYSSLAGGSGIDESLGLARLDAKNACEQVKICALPVLYALTDQSRIFDHQRREYVAFVPTEQQPLPGMTEGYAEDLIGRRADLKRLSAALREGLARSLVITGPDGSGKSTLATRLALDLASQGYVPLSPYSSERNPLSAARLLETVSGALAEADQKEAAELRDAGVALGARLKRMLKVIRQSRFLLLMDGLALDERSGRIKDEELAEFYHQMLKDADICRMIVTCRALPADAPTLPSRTWEWQLSGLSEAAFVRFLLQDRGVAERYRRGELTYKNLKERYLSVAGLPACIAQMRRALGLGERPSLCDDALSRLYSSLGQQSRLALSRAAIYGIGMSPAGLAAVAGLDEEKTLALIEEWHKLSLAYAAGDLWALSSSIKPWLKSALKPEEQRQAHRLAADFLGAQAREGRSSELGISRLDCLLEARGAYLEAGELENARETTSSISGFLERRGYYQEMVTLNLELLSKEKHPLPMTWIARASLDQGRSKEAEDWYSKAVAAGPNAAAYHGLGTAYLRQGKFDLAESSFEKAAEISRETSDLEGEAVALHGLATIDMEKKENEAALKKLRRVLEIQETLGDRQSKGATLQDMASIDLRMGDYKAAREKLHRSLEILKSSGNRRAVASALFNLGSIDMEQGELERAKEAFRDSLALRRVLGDERGEAAILHNLGQIEAQAGNMEKAREDFRDALRAYQDLGEKSGEAGAFFQLGVLEVQQNRIPEGLMLMALSAVILRSIASPEVGQVEPVVERLAAQLHYSQEQFQGMVRTVMQEYRRDKGRSLVKAGEKKKG
ncbi:MAG TPA: tetratricopeptide repeat protein [Methanothrix sp.]|nr:tetratricopeptide repeat protein [Methanothrix sp.]